MRKCDTCVHRELCEANCNNNYATYGYEDNCEGCCTVTCPSHSGNCEYYLSGNPEHMANKE